MSETCQAWAHRYVGKGKDRVLYEGPCVIPERGHDGEHLPSQLAMVQAYDAAFNAGVDAAVTALTNSTSQETGDLIECVKAVRR